MRHLSLFLAFLVVGCGGTIGDFPKGKTAASYADHDLAEVSMNAARFVNRPIRLSALVVTFPGVRDGSAEFRIAEKPGPALMQVICPGKLGVEAVKKLTVQTKIVIHGVITHIDYLGPTVRADRIEY